MVTVLCVFVNGFVGYSAEYVTRLRSMVSNNLSHRHRFLCLTDRAEYIRSLGIDAFEIPSPEFYYPWWAKVRLFDPDLPVEGRLLYLDLDSLVVRSLDDIVDYDADFALVPHAGQFEGKGERRIVKRFNSSVMVWNHGEQSHLFEDYHPSVHHRLWGDQDWIGERASHNARGMPLEWFPRLSMVGGREPGWDDLARVVLCKRPKNHEAARQWGWFDKMWR